MLFGKPNKTALRSLLLTPGDRYNSSQYAHYLSPAIAGMCRESIITWRMPDKSSEEYENV